MAHMATTQAGEEAETVLRDAMAQPRRTRRSPPKEEADDYPWMVVTDGKLRVIICKDDIQWILQHRSGGRWRGVSFHRDHEALVDTCTRKGFSDDAVAELRELEPWKL